MPQLLALSKWGCFYRPCLNLRMGWIHINLLGTLSVALPLTRTSGSAWFPSRALYQGQADADFPTGTDLRSVHEEKIRSAFQQYMYLWALAYVQTQASCFQLHTRAHTSTTRRSATSGRRRPPRWRTSSPRACSTARRCASSAARARCAKLGGVVFVRRRFPTARRGARVRATPKPVENARRRGPSRPCLPRHFFVVFFAR